MGARSIGIFDDPLAQAIRREFETALAAGGSAYAAATCLVEKYASTIHDRDSEPIIFYALAELQLQQGIISTKIRKRALTIINSGEGLERWQSEPAEIYQARQKLEQDLRARLVAMG